MEATTTKQRILRAHLSKSQYQHPLIGKEYELVYAAMDDYAKYKQMNTTTKTPTQALAELNEDSIIMNFVMEYRDGNPDFDGYVGTANLSAMIAAFKRKYVDANWYNAGIMAQRILQDDEIETLKKKLKQEEFNHTNTRISWDATTKERNELKEENEHLRNKIKLINELRFPNE